MLPFNITVAKVVVSLVSENLFPDVNITDRSKLVRLDQYYIKCSSVSIYKSSRKGGKDRDASHDTQLWFAHWTPANVPSLALWEASRYPFPWM